MRTRIYAVLLGSFAILFSAVAAETNLAARETAQVRLSVDLVDGSRVVGVPGIDAVPVQTSYAKMSVPLQQIQTLTISEDHETATIEMKNGDQLKGTVNLIALPLTTVFGKVSIDVEHLRQFDVVRKGGTLPDSLRKGLVLYFSFDRDEKEKVSDSSDEHNDGIVHGATWTPQGKTGGAYRFNGTSDYLAMKPASTMPDFGDFTVALWTCVQPRELQMDSSGGRMDRQYILSAHSDAVSGQYQTGFCLLYDFKGDNTGEIHNGTLFDVTADIYSEQNTRVDVAGKWHHLAFARHGTEDYTYLDGKLLDSTYRRKVQRNDPLNLNHTWSIGTFAGNNQTGSARNYNYSFRGLIDEVLVFRRALAADEVKQLFDLQK